VPLVALLGPATWMVATAALVLAQSWFFRYEELVRQSDWVWLVLVRDLLVVVLFALAIAALRGRAPEHEYPVLLEDQPPVRVPP
jgi:hypothetical protein